METKRRKVVQSEGRSIIASVYHFLKTEYEFTLSYKEPNCDLSHLRNITQRTADATGVSVRTVQRVLREEKHLPKTSSPKFPKPLKNRRKRDNKVDVDGFTAGVVRSTVQAFHSVHNQIPTLMKLQSVLHDKIGFDGCLETMRSLLKKLGYHWRKADSNRKVMVERHDIQMWRLKYLKEIAEYRSQGRPIIYADEGYVLTTYLRNDSYQENEPAPFLKKSKGASFILVHAGSDAGFIENACLVFKANTVTGNNNITFETYVKWLNEKLLPNLPERAVIVLNHASYHTTRVEKLPSTASKKSDMEEWLNSKGIEYDPSLRKVELYDIIKKQKKNFVTYQVDDFIKSKGFEVLRLPPMHPELNAIENIWGILKNHIALNNYEPNMTEKVINDSIGEITSDTWSNTCNSVIKKEVEYMKYLDTDFDLIVNLQDDTEEETDTEEESSCESN